MNFMETLELNKDAALMNRYLKWYSHGESMDIGEYLDEWYQKKSEYLLTMLNGKVIYRERIKYEASCKEKIETIRLFQDSPAYMDFFESVQGVYHLPHNDNIIHMILDILLSQPLLVSNTIDEEHAFHVTDPNGKVISFKKGHKVMRAIRTLLSVMSQFGDIAPHEAKDLMDKFENFRIAHSQLFNGTKVTGDLCISIHPLDYMTMSDNSYNWTSCMSWMDGGGYRAGTLEMMNSPCVVVAYLDGKKKFYPFANEEESWSNKKWRELFIIDRNFISGVKPYPYDNEYLEETVLNKIAELAEKNLGWKYDEKIKSGSHGRITVSENKSFYLTTNLMYNDTEHNSFIYRLGENAEITYHCYSYSGNAYCTVCGDIVNMCDETLCSEHSGRVSCDCCGDSYNRDDLIEVCGSLVCSYCYEQRCDSCVDCGKEFFVEDDALTYICYLTQDKQNNRFYLERSYDLMCADCLNNCIAQEDVKKIEIKGERYYVACGEYSKKYEMKYFSEIITSFSQEQFDKLSEEKKLTIMI